MPKYKLIYFNAMGWAETSRMLFALAGVEYEDFRFERSEWDEHYKSKTPFQQSPVLEVDGVQIADSDAIARYLAKEFGYAGKNRLEEARVDMYAGASHDLVKPLIQIHLADESKKEELRTKYNEETAPKFLNKFESTLSESSSGYLVGDGVTWVDLMFMQFMSYIETVLPAEVMSRYPKVKQHKQKIGNLPKVAEWIAKRPKTER